MAVAEPPAAISEAAAAEMAEEMSFEDEQPLTGPQRIVRALTFWSKVVPILAAYKAVELRGGTEEELAAKYEELHDWGSDRLQSAINELKGFYVKTGQVISTRVDLFPEQYTSKLASLQDDLDAMPAAQIKAVVKRELLLGEPLETIFASFDDEPLGSASIAQVHAATLLDGRKVAVKVQRPNCEPKLRGDIANLKSFSKKLASALPVDYYTVFCELERALQGELDFLAEAQSAMKVFASVSHTAAGVPTEPAVSVPLPVQGLASRRVLVMDFVEGTPLNRLAGEMEKRGIKPGSPESIVAGERILTQLTEAFGRMMLGAGFIHGDPHPGNIFVQPGAQIALIDCGQVKQIPQEARLRLAEAILLVNEWQETGGSPKLVALAQEKMAGFGVTFAEDAKPEAAAALALLLFGDPDTPMPGGFSSRELSNDSPIKAIASFPQELVLLGRATILIKGISKRLGVKWSLADKWKGMAEQALECGEDGCLMPTWSAVPTAAQLGRQSRGVVTSDTGDASGDGGAAGGRPRFREVLASAGASSKLLGKWAKAKGAAAMPEPVKKAVVRRMANKIAKQ
jgi:aarF domain-containing kinase